MSGDGVGFGTDSQASRHILPCVGSWWDRELGQLLLCSACGDKGLWTLGLHEWRFQSLSVHLKKKKKQLIFNGKCLGNVFLIFPCLLPTVYNQALSATLGPLSLISALLALFPLHKIALACLPSLRSCAWSGLFCIL